MQKWTKKKGFSTAPPPNKREISPLWLHFQTMTYEVQGTFCVPVLTSHLWVTDFSPTKVLSNPDLNTEDNQL